MERNSLQGKVIAVTGGASGIGLGIVHKLILLKAKIAVADVSPRPAELDDLPNLIYTKVDVSSREQVRDWVQEIVAKFGRLDGMCANAGICPFEGGIVNDELYQRILAVCLTGVWNCGTEAYWQFKKQGGGGTIVNTSSGAGLRAVKGLAAYSAAKHAVVGLTRAWALDWALEGIRVNALAPGTLTQLLRRRREGLLTHLPPTGLTESGMQRATFEQFPEVADRLGSGTPMGRMGKPSELADSVIFLLGDSASYVTGHILSCDGGSMSGA